MRKEIIFAIIAGGALGLIIAFGIWKANTAFKPKIDSPIVTPTPVTLFNDFKIVLARPNDRAVVTDTPINVSGITKANTYVVISGEDSDEITQASDSGAFTSSVDLSGGSNQIKLFAFDSEGNEADAKVMVIFSSQFSATSTTKDATNSGDPVRDNVSAKLQTALSAPQAYIGTVTDITDSTIQIKNNLGEIQQISTTKDITAYVKTTNDVTKQVKASDVAIGDFVIAMGVREVNEVLSASRILITDVMTESPRRAFFGTVVTKTTGKITLKNPKTDESITATIAKTSTVKENDKVIVVGEFTDGNIDSRTIQVVK